MLANPSVKNLTSAGMQTILPLTRLPRLFTMRKSVGFFLYMLQKPRLYLHI